MLFSSQRAGSGSTGYQPVPSGEPPDGMAMRFEYAVTIHSNLSLRLISLGESPSETGESPVPPPAGECQLRGEEQFSPGLPGIRAGSVGQAQGSPDAEEKV